MIVQHKNFPGSWYQVVQRLKRSVVLRLILSPTRDKHLAEWLTLPREHYNELTQRYPRKEVGYAVLGMTRKEARRAVWARIESLGLADRFPRSLYESV